MAAVLTSRRNLIVSGIMVWAGGWLPAGSLAGINTTGLTPPVWLAPLMKNLASLSSWIRTECEGGGDVVIHCGTRDFSAWAVHAGALAGRGRKVMAHGNTLTLCLPEKQVRIVLHPDIA